jgi:hypothetical protein
MSSHGPRGFFAHVEYAHTGQFQSYRTRSTLTFRALIPQEIGHHSQVNPIHFIEEALESWSAGQGKLESI